MRVEEHSRMPSWRVLTPLGYNANSAVNRDMWIDNDWVVKVGIEEEDLVLMLGLMCDVPDAAWLQVISRT